MVEEVDRPVWSMYTSSWYTLKPVARPYLCQGSAACTATEASLAEAASGHQEPEPRGAESSQGLGGSSHQEAERGTGRICKCGRMWRGPEGGVGQAS